jgi:hypothetical protein
VIGDDHEIPNLKLWMYRSGTVCKQKLLDPSLHTQVNRDSDRGPAFTFVKMSTTLENENAFAP